MKGTERKSSTTSTAANQQDEAAAEADTGLLAAAMQNKPRARHVEKDGTDMPGTGSAGDYSEATPELAENLEADIVAVDDAGDGTSLISINRGLDDHVYPMMTGILGGKHGAQYAVEITEATAGAARAKVNTTLYMLQHDSTMTVIINPVTRKHHKHRKHRHHHGG